MIEPLVYPFWELQISLLSPTFESQPHQETVWSLRQQQTLNIFTISFQEPAVRDQRRLTSKTVLNVGLELLCLYRDGRQSVGEMNHFRSTVMEVVLRIFHWFLIVLGFGVVEALVYIEARFRCG